MNINQNYDDLKNITPFKLCVLTNFPFIEADFDAVTNYQLLCKVVEKLNEIIANTDKQNSNIELLETNFATLYNFTKNYFDNLDVQEEINNKLDKMAEDGSLSALIKPFFDEYKKEIDGIVNTQNGKISVLENRMDSFSSLPNGSTTGDAELTDIRTPAAGFNLNKKYDNAGNAVRGQIDSVKDLAENGEFLLFNNIKNSSSAKKIEISDVTAESYTLNWNGTVLQGTLKSDVVTKKPILLNDYIFYCSFQRGTSPNVVIGYNSDLNTGLSINLTNGICIKYDWNNTTYTAFKTYTINKSIAGNVKIFIYYNGKNYKFFDENLSEICSIPALDLTGFQPCIGWEAGGSFVANNLYFYSIHYDMNTKFLNLLNGKTINFIGDSITNLGSGNNGWQHLIEKDINIKAINYGISGTCMTAKTLEDNTAMCIRYKDMEINEFVFCLAGINDYGTNKPLGEKNSTSVLDFTGALRTFIEGVYSKFLVASNLYQFRLFFASPYNVKHYFNSDTNDLGLTQLDYVNRAEEICAEYGIPFLNLYKQSGFNTINEEFLLYDKLHPSAAGHIMLAKIIEMFICTN